MKDEDSCGKETLEERLEAFLRELNYEAGEKADWWEEAENNDYALLSTKYIRQGQYISCAVIRDIFRIRFPEVKEEEIEEND